MVKKRYATYSTSRASKVSIVNCLQCVPISVTVSSHRALDLQESSLVNIIQVT